jgi:hypothetical protein
MTKTLLQEIKRAQKHDAEMRRLLAERNAEYDRKHAAIMEQARTWVKKCVPATVDDYCQWLHEYVENGGEITHVYNYPFKQQSKSFLVARSDLEITPLFGASSRHVIIPAGVNCSTTDLGHNTVYRHASSSTTGASVEGTPFVPLFSDIGA